MSGHDDEHGMDVIVRTSARWLKGFIVVYGANVVLHGHLGPGGGFAGGVIIACGFMLVCLAGGATQATSVFSRRAASTLDCVGVLVFLALGCIAMARPAGAFLENLIATPETARFELLSGGTIALANVALGLKVASSLFLVFIALAAFRVAHPGRDEESDKP